jgi:hypothetical protein
MGMLTLLARIMPTQKDAPPPQHVYKTAAEFNDALRARGLPTLDKLFGLQYHKKPDMLIERDGRIIDMSVEPDPDLPVPPEKKP